MNAGLGAKPNSPRLKRTVSITLERIGVQFLRHEVDLLARARIGEDLQPSAITSPPDGLTMPQMMLMSVVLPAPLGAEKRENLTPHDVEVDRLQRLQAAPICLADVADGDDGLHLRLASDCVRKRRT